MVAGGSSLIGWICIRLTNIIVRFIKADKSVPRPSGFTPVSCYTCLKKTMCSKIRAVSMSSSVIKVEAPSEITYFCGIKTW